MSGENELDIRLLILEEKLHRKKKLQKRLFHTRQALERERVRLQQLEVQLEKEGEELKKIEGMSLPALFYTLLGTKERQAQIERREFLEIKLQRDEAAYSIKEMEREIEQSQAELNELEGVGESYKTALMQKEQLLLENHAGSAADLNRIASELASLRSQQSEISEAVSAGTGTRDALDELIDSLKSAGNWGVWDLIGGGLIATAGKHSRMDEARDHLHRVQGMIEKFRRELSDVEQAVNGIDFQMGEFERFADIFFDGLIVDWMVQAKIEGSLSTAREARQKVVGILKSLTLRQEQIDRQIERLELDREHLIREV